MTLLQSRINKNRIKQKEWTFFERHNHLYDLRTKRKEGRIFFTFVWHIQNFEEEKGSMV